MPSGTVRPWTYLSPPPCTALQALTLGGALGRIPVYMLSRYNIPLWVKPHAATCCASRVLFPALTLGGARRRTPVYMLTWYKFHYGLNFR